MKLNNLNYTYVLAACLFIVACSESGSAELSRDSAAVLITNNLSLPKTLSAKLKKTYVKETKIVQPHTPGLCAYKSYPPAEKDLLQMVANGVIELSERQVIQNKCAHTFVDVKLTQQGSEFKISETNQEYTLRTAEVVFDQVTGIRSSEADTTAIAEYAVKIDNLTPFFVTEPQISKQGTKYFAKYDDGWRIIR